MRFVWLLGLVGCHREAAPVVAAKPAAVVPARVVEAPKLVNVPADDLGVSFTGSTAGEPAEPDYADALAAADRFGGAIVIGHVTDMRSGEPMAGATVVASPDDGPTQVAITDELGAYRLDLPRGSYAFSFYYADYSRTHGIDITGSIVVDETIDQTYVPPPPPTITTDDDFIVSIPVPGRTFEDALGAAADEQGDVAEDQIE